LSPESVQVIVNPTSGGGKVRRLIPELEVGLREMGVPGPIRFTEGPGHAGDLARRAVEEGTSRLLVVGGDGTVHEVANGLLSGEEGPLPAISLLPVGTGNDFHRMIRGPGGVEGALRRLRDGTPRLFDVGEVRWDGERRYFVNLLGVGVDAEVLRRREGFTWLTGLAQYLAALGGALFTFKGVPLVVTVDGAPQGVECEVLLAAVTVGPSVGGGFLLAPAATPDDGLLDLFVVERLGLLKIMQYLPRVLRGTLDGEPEIHVHRLTGARFRSPDGSTFPFELDGELMPTEAAALEVGIRPACLPVLEIVEEEG
jgi:diacylglycerol kinase (ATP)